MPPIGDEWDPELIEKAKDAYHVEENIEESRQQAIAHIPKNHPWHQQGPFITCDSCRPTHSMYVGPLKSLTRLETGEYELRDRLI